jgi:hypothetical protein
LRQSFFSRANDEGMPDYSMALFYARTNAYGYLDQSIDRMRSSSAVVF